MSGGGEIRGKDCSDGSEDASSYMSSSFSLDSQRSDAISPRRLSLATHTAEEVESADGGGGINFEDLPRDCPTDAGAIAPRGRPSDVHTFHIEHMDYASVFNDTDKLHIEDFRCDFAPFAGINATQTRPGSHPLPRRPFIDSRTNGRPPSVPVMGCTRGEGASAGGLGVNLENLPRDCPTDIGAIAPRRHSGDLKACYEAAGLVSLRGCVRSLSEPLCEQVAELRLVCREIETALQKAQTDLVSHRAHQRAQMEVQQRVSVSAQNAPEDVQRALEKAGEALEEVLEMREAVERAKEESVRRLHTLEIEIGFKLHDAQARVAALSGMHCGKRN